MARVRQGARLTDRVPRRVAAQIHDILVNRLAEV